MKTLLLGAEQARAEGYAMFNDCDHLCVDIPDGMTTISCRTSDGRRVTFSFLPYKTGGTPECVDIQYHDAPERTPWNGKQLPVQQVLGFAGGSTPIDSRTMEKKPTLVCLLIESAEGRKKPGDA